MLRLGIKTKLIIMIMAVALPLFAASLYHEFKELRRAGSAAQKRTLHQAHRISADVDTFLNGGEQILIALSENPAIKDQDWERCRAILSSLKLRYPYYENIFAIDRDGWVHCSAVKQDKPAYVRDRSYFQEVMKRGRFTLGEVQIGRVTKKPVVVMAYPVRDSSGSQTGMVGAAISLLRLQELFGHMELTGNAAVTLLDRKGRIIASTAEPESTVLKDVSEESWFKEIVKKGNGIFELRYSGEERLTAVSSPSKANWYATVSVPSEEIYSPIRKYIMRSISFYLLILVLALALSWLLGKRIASPLLKLADGARELSAGGLGINVEIKSGDELEYLARSFNQMSVEIKAREETLRSGEERFSSLVQSASDAIISADSRGMIISWNRGAEKVFGYAEEEAVDKPLTILMPERYREAHQKGLERMYSTGESHVDGKTIEVHGLRKDGSEFPLELSLSRWKAREETFCTAIVRDITDRKRLEDQLRHAQKMEAIGQLAGGVAHDFNNILNAILGFGSLIKDKMKEDDPNLPYLEEVLAAGERAVHLTQSLLAFSRKQALDIKPVNVNNVVAGVKNMLSRIIGEDIEFRTALSDRELTVMADYGQIVQVLMNLATNARDAMPDGGLLTIMTGHVDLDKEFVKAHGYGNAGEYALMSVTDTGKGMDEATRERIFEPFFTTKEMGRGTGLGLAIVYGILKQHNGYINVYSESGKGTTFKTYLPLIKEEAEDKERTVLSLPEGGTETILMAEDDEAMRRLMKDVLEYSGYSVIVAVDGEDAVNRFIEHKDKIQLIILDVIMPRKSGREAYEAIKGIRPDIKAVFMSGYTDDIMQKKGMLDKDVDLILKPVSPNELLRKVREVLDK